MKSEVNDLIKMKHLTLTNDTMILFDHLSQCLEEWEQIIPNPSHIDLKKQWKSDMKTYIESINDTEDHLIDSISSGLVEAFNEWDTDDYVECVDHNITFALMQRPQTTQRTADWYTEFKRCLTASELYKVFGSPRERGTLVLQKAGKIELSSRSGVSVSLRNSMSPFDWGICFEPVVKQILEFHWSAIIHDVGRFVHLTDTRLAASPDGLIIKSDKHPDMGGHLLEIKCPKSRTIGLKVPMEYYYQMQLQLEVTGVRACEYVEARFDFINDEDTGSEFYGKLAIVGCFNEEASEWLPCKYVYGPIKDIQWTPDLGFNEKVLELHTWKCEAYHHVRVYRDELWFASLKSKLDEFWEDVEKAKIGDFLLPESSRKKKEIVCLIKDDSDDTKNESDGRI
jgi:hypothetical protein